MPTLETCDPKQEDSFVRVYVFCAKMKQIKSFTQHFSTRKRADCQQHFHEPQGKNSPNSHRMSNEKRNNHLLVMPKKGTDVVAQTSSKESPNRLQVDHEPEICKSVGSGQEPIGEDGQKSGPNPQAHGRVRAQGCI